jgi:hypothetical protein
VFVSFAAMGRIPSHEHLPQRPVQSLGAGLEEQVGAFLRPLHLLLFGKALADDGVDRGLGEGRGDPLAIAPSLAVVRNGRGVVVDVDPEFPGGPGEPLQARIVVLQALDAIHHPLGPEQRLTDVAVPQIPLDLLKIALDLLGCLAVMMGEALGVLAEHGQAHGDVEPIEDVLGTG